MRVRRLYWTRLGVAVIGEAVGYLVRNRQVPVHPTQQQGAGIGSDGSAVEISHHATAQGHPALTPTL